MQDRRGSHVNVIKEKLNRALFFFKGHGKAIDSPSKVIKEVFFTTSDEIAKYSLILIIQTRYRSFFTKKTLYKLNGTL
jgi:hypothetical protein